MEGVFHRPKRKFIWSLILPIPGAGFVIFGVLGLLKWKPEGADDRFALVFIGCFGAVCIILWLLFCLFPYGKGEFSVNEEHFHIDAGLFSKLDCDLSEVSGATAYASGMLTIRLRNGKNVSVLWLQNQWELAKYINKQLTENHRFKDKTPVSELRVELSERILARKKKLVIVFIGIALMFVYIILCIILTGGKDLSDFTETDELYFKVFIILEVANFILTMIFANKTGLMANEITVLRERISENTIASKDYPPGIVYRVFATGDLSERITVMKIPGSEKVYYVRESIRPGGEIVAVEDSSIYPSFEELLPELDGYIEITDKE